jgi:hypothetical protein
MTDRELLELAAKAAGFSTSCYFDGEMFGADRYEFYEGPSAWNPLTDDADALRLAVKLKFNVECLGDATQVNFIDGRYNTRHFNVGKDEGCNGDPYAATRRAIVRAAAEIGKGIV